MVRYLCLSVFICGSSSEIRYACLLNRTQRKQVVPIRASLRTYLESVGAFVEGMDFEQFRTDDKTFSAVVRKLEIVGEAAKHIPEHVREKYPSVPWKEMAGMRDRLIHAYFGIDEKLLWRVVTNRIPKIKPLIQNSLEELAE